MLSRERILTIVIATYNAAEFLPSTLASIEMQAPIALERCEVIIVDGASTDNTVDLARRSPIVTTVVSEPDSGIYDAMNKGAKIACGDWLHFLNAGDVFATRDSLAQLLLQIEAWTSANRIWGIGRALNLSSGTGRSVLIPNFPHRWLPHMLGIQPHCHQASWFDRTVFLAFGGHATDLGIVGDFDLILRFGMLARPGQADSVLIGYLGGGISERSRSELPRLLHDVRVRRFSLSGAGNAIDRGLSVAVSIANHGRISLGSTKALWKRSLSRRRGISEAGYR